MNPRYEVVVWYKMDSVQYNLPSLIIARVGREPDESAETQDFGDLHWNCPTKESAIKYAESLLEFAAFEGIDRFVVNGYGDESFESKFYKISR